MANKFIKMQTDQGIYFVNVNTISYFKAVPGAPKIGFGGIEVSLTQVEFDNVGSKVKSNFKAERPGIILQRNFHLLLV